MSVDQSYQSLKEAIEAGDLEKVKDLVENGNFDLNDPNLEENEKPLIRAVISQSPGLVEYLIEKGAKVDEAKEALYAACKMACSYDRLRGEETGTDDLRIIRYLLENGADPNFEKLNETPLDVVCSSSEGGYGKRLEIIKVLVETGALEIIFSIQMMIILIGNRLLSLKMGGLGTLKAYILKPVTEVTLPFATSRETGFDSIPCPTIFGKFPKELPRTVKSNLSTSIWYLEMSSI